MKKLDPASILQLPNNDCHPYTSITSDGTFYYLPLLRSYHIHKVDKDGNLISTSKTNHSFLILAYDETLQCFWASDDTHPYLYQLNDKFEIMKCFRIDDIGYDMWITDIVVHDTSLFVSFHQIIIELTKECQFISIITRSNYRTFQAFAFFSFGYMVIAENGCEQEICIFSNKNKLLKKLQLKTPFIIESIVLKPCMQLRDGLLEALFLVHRDDFNSFLIRVLLPVFDDVMNDFQKDHNTSVIDNQCEGKSCDEGKPCDKECCTCDDCFEQCDDTCINDIIESIALIETALSHILNAEGEKLQKAIELTDNVCDLLEINRSINQTITKITHLEQVLYAKLSLIQDMSIHDKTCNDI